MGSILKFNWEKPPGCPSPEALSFGNPPGEVDERGELSIGSLTRGFLAMPVVLDSFEVVMRWELSMTPNGRIL